ncbi:plasmid partitioning protein RepB [Leisingera methylohalidivorans]|uniref:Chromosome partitioning protein ParB n=1 Tax=Leisingera methylohalidivorans DSM 14336 TaxID=999552 RepID=V9W190_9RHOB|nr:plasmid partitioning protein RepB [Leisingera methylohalidivorans]AHD03440.1 chromosome partitioning protein ParB [Leisingera methylohalidivorans DSM 14336]
MARKGILSTALNPGTPAAPAAKPKMIPRGAVGALQSSLSKLQESAVQEIDTALIDNAGYEDRLGMDGAAFNQLKDSLQTYGQQVPVLLRPHPKTAGRFEIVYGRRRLKALRELGQPVKAMVRQLDDHALVMAQGQENTSRQDLSFIEKAAFAAQLQADGYGRQTIAAALSIDLPMVSRMLKVGTAFDLPFLRLIGSAPGIGRDRWMTLVKQFEVPGARNRALAYANTPDFLMNDSDGRFEAALKRAQDVPREPKPAPAPPKTRALAGRDGAEVAGIKTTAKGVTLTIAAKDAPGFDAWFDAHAEDIITELHGRWQQDQPEQPED